MKIGHHTQSKLSTREVDRDGWGVTSSGSWCYVYHESTPTSQLLPTFPCVLPCTGIVGHPGYSFRRTSSLVYSDLTGIHEYPTRIVSTTTPQGTRLPSPNPTPNVVAADADTTSNSTLTRSSHSDESSDQCWSHHCTRYRYRNSTKWYTKSNHPESTTLSSHNNLIQWTDARNTNPEVSSQQQDVQNLLQLRIRFWIQVRYLCSILLLHYKQFTQNYSLYFGSNLRTSDFTIVSLQSAKQATSLYD